MTSQSEFNSFSLINYLWKWRKLFLIICGTAGILSFVFSTKTFIRPQFKATTIIYAPRTNSVSKILLNSNANERLDVKAYAIEEETEQMMQILNSREIKDMLIDRYDLANYYEITPNMKGWQSKLYEAVDGAVDIKRTKYGAIAISVKDWNPDQAAQMANSIAAELDTIKNRIEYERAFAACIALENQLRDAEAQRQIVTDSLDVLSKNGVFVYDYQVERVMQQHAIALAQGNMAGVQRLQKEIEKLEKWGTVSISLRREQIFLSDQIALIRLKLLSAQMDVSGVMPVKFVIEKAIAPDKKVYPKKLYIAILSTLGAFIITLMTLLITDKIRQEINVNNKKAKESAQQE